MGIDVQSGYVNPYLMIDKNKQHIHKPNMGAYGVYAVPICCLVGILEDVGDSPRQRMIIPRSFLESLILLMVG